MVRLRFVWVACLAFAVFGTTLPRPAGATALGGCSGASSNVVTSLLNTAGTDALNAAFGAAFGNIQGALDGLLGGAASGLLNGLGLGGLTGGLLSSILGGGEVAVKDQRNIKAAEEQVELLEQILAAENVTCMTLERILAAIGVAGPAGNTQNPMVNLPMYAGKVFAVYRDTTNTAAPQNQGNTTQPLSAALPSVPGIPGQITAPITGVDNTVAGFQNLLQSNPELFEAVFGGAEGYQGMLQQISGISGLLDDAMGIFNQASSIIGTINSVIGTVNSVISQVTSIFGPGPQGFLNRVDQVCAVTKNIFAFAGNIQNVTNPTGGGGFFDATDVCQKIDTIMNAGGSLANPSSPLGVFTDATEIATVIREATTVTEENCDGDITTCLQNTGVTRQEMYTNVTVGTAAKAAASQQNVREQVRQLVYGVDDTSCPADSTDLKCVSLMRMMSGSSSLREDIQTNTAAVLTAMSFQLIELELMADSNIMQAIPAVISAPAINTPQGSGD